MHTLFARRKSASAPMLILLALIIVNSINRAVAMTTTVVATSGPFVIVNQDSAMATHAEAKAACAARGHFLGVPTTWDELDHALAALYVLSKDDKAHVGLSRTGTYDYRLDDGPNSGSTYSTGRGTAAGPLRCAKQVCPWFGTPSGSNMVTIDWYGTLKDVNSLSAEGSVKYYALCQQCVLGQSNCKFNSTEVPKVTAIGSSGKFVLTEKLSRSTITMANKACQTLGGWLGQVETAAEKQSIDNIKSQMTTQAWMDGFADENAVFVRLFGPKAGQVVSRGVSPNTTCVQKACFWAANEPNDYYGPEDVIDLRKDGLWNDIKIHAPLRGERHVLCQICETDDAACAKKVAAALAVSTEVIATAGPYKLLSHGAYSFPVAKASCEAQGAFLATVTTRDELDFIVYLMQNNATKDRAVAGVLLYNTQSVDYRIDGGPNSGQVYSAGKKDQGSCKHELCNWWASISSSTKHKFTLFHRKGYLFDDDDIGASNIMCQTCVPSDPECRFAPPDVEQPGVATVSGPFLLTKKITAPKTMNMAQRMCETFGGWLAMYSTTEEDQFIDAALSFADASAMVDGTDLNNTGLFVRRFGPHAGAPISSGFSPKTNCLQSRCFWSGGEPNNYADVGEGMIELRTSGKWNDNREMMPVSNPYHILCQLCERTNQTCMDTKVSQYIVPVEVIREAGPFALIDVSAPTQAGANAECAKKGWWLASVRTEAEFEYVVQLMWDHNWRAYLGGRRDEGSDIFKWRYGPYAGQVISTGHTGDVFLCQQAGGCFFRSGEPNSRSSENIIELAGSRHGLWNDISDESFRARPICQRCDPALPSCEMNDAIPDISVEKRVGPYIRLKGSIYTTPDMANKICEKQGGWLATVRSADESELIKLVMDGTSSSSNAWLGGRRISGDTYAWKYGPLKGHVINNGRTCEQEYCNWASTSSQWDAFDDVLLNHEGKWIIGKKHSGLEHSRHVVCQTCELSDPGCMGDTPAEVVSESGPYKLYEKGAGLIRSHASAFCSKKGGWLASIRTADEKAHVTSIMAALPGSANRAVVSAVTTPRSIMWDDGPAKGVEFLGPQASDCQDGTCPVRLYSKGNTLITPGANLDILFSDGVYLTYSAQVVMKDAYLLCQFCEANSTNCTTSPTDGFAVSGKRDPNVTQPTVGSFMRGRVSLSRGGITSTNICLDSSITSSSSKSLGVAKAACNSLGMPNATATLVRVTVPDTANRSFQVLGCSPFAQSLEDCSIVGPTRSPFSDFSCTDVFGISCYPSNTPAWETVELYGGASADEGYVVTRQYPNEPYGLLVVETLSQNYDSVLRALSRGVCHQMIDTRNAGGIVLTSAFELKLLTEAIRDVPGVSSSVYFPNVPPCPVDDDAKVRKVADAECAKEAFTGFSQSSGRAMFVTCTIAKFAYSLQSYSPSTPGYEGRLLVRVNPQLDPLAVCQQGFDRTAARSVCRSLGRGFANATFYTDRNERFSSYRSSLRIGCESVYTNGVDACEFEYQDACDLGQDVFIRCDDDVSQWSAIPVSDPADGNSTRIVLRHADPSEGNSTFGLCGSADSGAARAVCASMGHRVSNPMAHALQSPAAVLRTTKNISNLRCPPGVNHSAIEECRWETGSGVEDVECVSHPGIAFDCREHSWEFKVDPIPGADNKSGVLRARYVVDGTSTSWGHICDDTFDTRAATVVCRQLGLGSRGVPLLNRHSGNVSAMIMTSPRCGGDENSLQECSFYGPGHAHSCTNEPSRAVGIWCDPPQSPSYSTDSQTNTIIAIAAVAVGGTALTLVFVYVLQNRTLRKFWKIIDTSLDEGEELGEAPTFTPREGDEAAEDAV